MGRRYDSQNYYNVLEIERTAPRHEIHQAYLKAKSTYAENNPALYSMFTKEEARELLNLIEEAFLVLGNQQKREQYDRKILELEDSSTPSPSAVGNSLPDFPEPNMADFASPSRQNSDRLPKGFARTKVSKYRIDGAFEEAIAATDGFTGPIIQSVRKYKNITLEQMSKEIRVSKQYIAAIEAEDYHGLPAPVFVRGFVLQMARTLGLNEEKVTATYMNRFKATSLE